VEAASRRRGGLLLVDPTVPGATVAWTARVGIGEWGSGEAVGGDTEIGDLSVGVLPNCCNKEEKLVEDAELFFSPSLFGIFDDKLLSTFSFRILL